MSLRKLRTLLAIEQTGSFVAAAEKLGLTQSAVSQQMRALETQLEIMLFERHGRSPRMTTDAYTLCRRAQQQLDDYQKLADDLGSGENGRLAIGATYMVQTGSLAPVLADFRRRWSGVYLQVFRGMSSDLIARVESGELDAVVTTGPPRQVARHCRWETLDAEMFYLVAPVEMSGSGCEQMLSTADYIRFDRRAWAGTLIDEELRRQGMRLRETVELDSLQAAFKMIEHGLGVTIMPLSPHLRDEIADRFYLVPFAEQRLRREVGFYSQKETGRQALVDALLAAFMRHYGL